MGPHNPHDPDFLLFTLSALPPELNVVEDIGTLFFNVLETLINCFLEKLISLLMKILFDK